MSGVSYLSRFFSKKPMHNQGDTRLSRFFYDLAVTIDEDPGVHVHHKELVLSHLAALYNEALNWPELRTASIIKSSWGVVVREGKKMGLFEVYKGNDALRREVIDFLKS